LERLESTAVELLGPVEFACVQLWQLLDPPAGTGLYEAHQGV
jgi:hypothetical protein